MGTDIDRQTAPIGPAIPAITPQRIHHAVAEGRRLQGLAMRTAFTKAVHLLGALPGKLAAWLRDRDTSGSCYRPAR